MKEVKRYDGKVGHNPDGGYVSHEDYAEEKQRADQNAQYLETLTERMLDAEQERDALRQQLTATTNSLTNAQEALKSAGIEADTVQAGVMELKAQRDGIAALAEERRQFIVNGVETGDITLPVIDADPATVIYERCLLKPMFAHDAYLNAVRAEGLDMAADEVDRWIGCDLLAREIRQKSAQLRAGNAGKDGSHE